MACQRFFLLALALVPRLVWAYGSGVVGYSGKSAINTCANCHSGAAADAGAVTATLSGPATLAAGGTGLYTLTITGGPAIVGGLDVSASAGTFTVGQAMTQVLIGELTHNQPLGFVGGTLKVVFNYTAPATPGLATLYAAGVSANGNLGSAGDAPATTTMTVTVGPATDAGGGILDGGAGDGGVRGDGGGGGGGDGGGGGGGDGGGGGMGDGGHMHDGGGGPVPPSPSPDMAQRLTMGGTFLGCSAAPGAAGASSLALLAVLALLILTLRARRG